MILPRLRGPRRPRSPGVAAFLLAIAGCGCAAAPRPTAASLALAANPRAALEGRVVSAEGTPVAGISVYAMPWGRDIFWSPPSVTDSAGRFRILVDAPAEYGFLLRWEGRTVVTPGPRDPARVIVSVGPGQTREGIELVFLREAWKEIENAALP